MQLDKSGNCKASQVGQDGCGRNEMAGAKTEGLV